MKSAGEPWPASQRAQAAPSPSCVHTGSFVSEAARKELGTFLGLIPSHSRLGCSEEESMLGSAGRSQVVMADDAGVRAGAHACGLRGLPLRRPRGRH